MNPLFESYINQEFTKREFLSLQKTWNSKPNLKNKLETYSTFLNQLKTQMLRECILSILEAEPKSLKYSSCYPTQKIYQSGIKKTSQYSNVPTLFVNRSIWLSIEPHWHLRRFIFCHC